MINTVVIIGSILVLLSAGLLAYALSGQKTKKTPVFADKEFQIWAFGHVLEDDIPLCQIPHLWNLRNPEHKIRSDFPIMESIKYMLKRYSEQKH